MVSKGTAVVSSTSSRRRRTSSPIHCPARSSAEHRCQKSVKLSRGLNQERIPDNQRGFETDIQLLRGRGCTMSGSRPLVRNIGDKQGWDIHKRRDFQNDALMLSPHDATEQPWLPPIVPISNCCDRSCEFRFWRPNKTFRLVKHRWKVAAIRVLIFAHRHQGHGHDRSKPLAQTPAEEACFANRQ